VSGSPFLLSKGAIKKWRNLQKTTGAIREGAESRKGRKPGYLPYQDTDLSRVKAGIPNRQELLTVNRADLGSGRLTMAHSFASNGLCFHR